METLGSLLDKLSIETIRLEKIKQAEAPEEIVFNVTRKVGSLKVEIDSYIFHAIKGDMVLEEPKFKFYKNEKPSNEHFDVISEAFSRLVQANYTLWNLEDKRRDKSIDDKERLQVCDDVGKWNRIRNDAMDSINSILTKQISKT
jgi:hypothetical protein